MAIDIGKWLKEDMGFSDDEVKELTPKFTPDRVTKLDAAVLRQSDYSRNMDAVKAAQTEAAAANERLTAEMSEWAILQASGEKQTKAQKDALDAAEARALKLQQTLRDIAVKAGLDPDAILKGIEVVVVPAKKDEPPPFDASKFVDRDGAATLARMSLTMPAELAALAHEHHELTGEWLDPRSVTNEIIKRVETKGNTKSLDPREVWSELNDIPTKRTAKTKATYDADIAAAEKRGAERALSDQTLPGAILPGERKAPVFKHLAQADGAPHKSVLDRPQPQQTVSAAVSALRTGKYRVQPGGPAAKTG